MKAERNVTHADGVFEPREHAATLPSHPPPPAHTGPASIGVVVLTQGRRPVQLQTGLRSLQAQTGVDLDIVVVGNGWAPTQLPKGVRAKTLPDNLGIPQGRNAGVASVRGELLFFLDDDAALRDPDTLERIARMFADNPDLGLVQPRVVDPAGGRPPRRWTPRILVGDPGRSSDVTAVWEGAVVIRRALFDQIGGWPDTFIYMHEGIDLAWAVWDAGSRVRYVGDLVALHPAISSGQHPNVYRMSMRNRVFIARRRLPIPLAAAYLTVWTILTVVREPNLAALKETLRGAIEGIREDSGIRRPMSWRTVWRMARAGRPPII